MSREISGLRCNGAQRQDTSALREAQRDYEVLVAASAVLAQSAARTCPLIGSGLAPGGPRLLKIFIL